MGLLGVAWFFALWTDLDHVLTLLFYVVLHVGSKDAKAAAKSTRK
jgi:hypothetical protein